MKQYEIDLLIQKISQEIKRVEEFCQHDKRTPKQIAFLRFPNITKFPFQLTHPQHKNNN